MLIRRIIDSMKKVIRITVIFLCIVFIGVIGFKTWSAGLVKEAMELEIDGTYPEWVQQFYKLRFEC